MRLQCPVCKGTGDGGTTGDGKKAKCYLCHGQGHVPEHNGPIPSMPQECLDAFIHISRIGASMGYPVDSWTKESITRHACKAGGHLFKFFMGSTAEDHLLHAFWRLGAAVALLIRGRVHFGGRPFNVCTVIDEALMNRFYFFVSK